MKLQDLKSVCAQFPTHTEERFKQPLRAGNWTMATDGRGLLAIRESYKSVTATLVGKKPEKLFEVDLGDQELPLAPLREFVGVADKHSFCDLCGNGGRIRCVKCGGDGEIECECGCDIDHTRNCPKCRGNGYFPCPNGCRNLSGYRYGIVNGLVFDLNLFGAFLAPVNDNKYRARIPPQESLPLVIGGADWRLVIMPMRGGAEKDTPRFEIAGRRS